MGPFIKGTIYQPFGNKGLKYTKNSMCTQLPQKHAYMLWLTFSLSLCLPMCMYINKMLWLTFSPSLLFAYVYGMTWIKNAETFRIKYLHTIHIFIYPRWSSKLKHRILMPLEWHHGHTCTRTHCIIWYNASLEKIEDLTYAHIYTPVWILRTLDCM